MPEDLALFVRFAPYRAKSWHFWSRSCSWRSVLNGFFRAKFPFRGDQPWAPGFWSTAIRIFILSKKKTVWMLSKEYPDGQRGSFHAKSLQGGVHHITTTRVSGSYIEPVHGAYSNQRMEGTTWYKKTKEKWVSPNFWWGNLNPLGFNRFDIELDILDDLELPLLGNHPFVGFSILSQGPWSCWMAWFAPWWRTAFGDSAAGEPFVSGCFCRHLSLRRSPLLWATWLPAFLAAFVSIDPTSACPIMGTPQMHCLIITFPVKYRGLFWRELSALPGFSTRSCIRANASAQPPALSTGPAECTEHLLGGAIVSAAGHWTELIHGLDATNSDPTSCKSTFDELSLSLSP